MSRLTRWMDHVLYPNYGGNWDNLLFREAILKTLAPDNCILDLGSGAGIVEYMNFRGKAAKVCGVDPDERVKSNPYLDEAKVGFADKIPYPDNTFDLVFATHVLEHLERPAAVFVEVARVLKPGGIFLVKTPNKWHYIPLMARLTPHSFHEFFNRLRGREGVDTFPTLYRANTPEAIREFADIAALFVREIHLIEGRPEYMRIFFPTYVVGWLYERWVNFVPGFSRFRVVLIATLQMAESCR